MCILVSTLLSLMICQNQESEVFEMTARLNSVYLALASLGVVFGQDVRNVGPSPYMLKLRSWEDCGPRTADVLIFDARIRKYNRTMFVLNGPVYLPSDFDDSLTGPYDMKVRSWEDCGPRTADVLIFNARIRKYNRTMFVVHGPVMLPKDFDDSLTATVELAVFANNRWKENFFKKDFPELCKIVKAWVWEFYLNLMDAANLPHRCPIRKGNYTVDNFPLQLDLSKHIPALIYNKYKWKSSLYTKDHRLYGCMQAIIDIVPKKKTLI